MLRHLIIAGTLMTFPALTVQARVEPPAPSPREDGQETYVGEMPERYAQVRALSGNVTIFKGGEAEDLTRGTPVSEGDVIESRGRGVLQLADGTRIAFGEDTRLTLATLFVERDGRRQVVLRLDRGDLRVVTARDEDTLVRVDTPSGRVTLHEGDDASLDLESDRTLRLKVFRGKASLANSAERTSLGAGERITVYGDQDRLNRIRDFNTYDIEGFDRWAGDAMAPRRSQSASRVPREIRAYADDLDENGEWIRVEDVDSYVWRPRVSVEWRPYWQGRWGCYSGGMTWISSDPWGYVTHHHGRWGWSARWGWYWIPGAYYAPAWVAWNWTDAHMGWAPIGYWNTPVHCGWGHWGGGISWNIVSRSHIRDPYIHRTIIVERDVMGTWRDRFERTPSRTPMWQQTPLVIRRDEFRNPDRLGTVLRRDTQVERITEFRRTDPGRVVFSRTPTVTPDRTVGRDRTAPDRGTQVPFTQLGTRELERRTVPSQGQRDAAARDAAAGRIPDRRTDTTRTDRTPDRSERRFEDRRTDTSRTDRTPDRSERRFEERRTETPRTERAPERTERAPERTERRVEERRVETPRTERAPERAPERRIEAPRTERAPERAPERRIEPPRVERAPERAPERRSDPPRTERAPERRR